MTCDVDNQPLTENYVRKFVADTILRTLDAGYNPYQQAMESDVHTFGSWRTHIPSVDTGEEMFESDNRNCHTEWIMQTDEMQKALTMFRNKRPSDNDDPECSAWEMDDEAIYDIQVDSLLAYLIPTEGDWQ